MINSVERARLPTPLGVLELVASGGGLLCIDLPENVREATPASRVLARCAPSNAPGQGLDPQATLLMATAQLDEYFRGTRRSFSLPLDLRSTAFGRRVLGALTDIPYGDTESYGRLAARIGSPGAARAVGVACARNPLPIVIPCHRVVGADGALVGYAGGVRGLGFKAALILLEQKQRVDLPMQARLA